MVRRTDLRLLRLGCLVGMGALGCSSPRPDLSAPAEPPARPQASQPAASAPIGVPGEAAPTKSRAAEAAPEAVARVRFSLRPLGAELPPEDVAMVGRALAAFFDFELVTEAALPLPREAFYQPRRRYRAEKLLSYLNANQPPGSFRILGLTAVDISTSKPGYDDWGILGLATIDGRASVISSFRTRRGARDAEEARVRLGKTAVHEIGHTLGLEHCPHVGCLMEDAKGSVFTTDGEYELCDDCRAALEHSGYALEPLPVSPPWPRPNP